MRYPQQCATYIYVCKYVCVYEDNDLKAPKKCKLLWKMMVVYMNFL